MKHEQIISKMTLEEKATLLTGKDFWQTMDYPQYGIPSIFLSDGPHGLRKQAAAADHLGLNASIPATCFPTAAAMANSWDEQLGQKLGEALGEEAAAEKVNVILGPGSNMKRNPRCGRNFEYFSEDPYLAGKIAASYIRGIQENGTAACVKHFAGNNQEIRRMTYDSVVDERTMREIYLTQFEIAVKEGQTEVIMSSYNRLNGDYANESKHLLRDILRDEWGFQGVVVTDWGGCNDRPLGVECGNELEMPSCKYGIADIVKAVEEGTLDVKYVDECVDRLLTLIDNTSVPGRKGEDGFDKEAHHQLAQQCAESSVVLLQNNGVLPLNGEVKVAVVGDFVDDPRYQGAGSSVVNPTMLDTAQKCLPDSGLNVIGFENGFNRFGKKNNGMMKKAVKLAEKADVVLLYLGLDEVTEAEGLDRENIKIPQNQIDLYKAIKATGKQVVIVLSCGSCVELDWAEDADALVYACLTGQAGARAVLNVVTGKVNPSGKLAETFPVKYEDCSSANFFPGNRVVEYREGPFIGYRYYNTAKVPVRFPFGFGMSYTTFEYSDLKVAEDGVTFTLKNTGKCDGAEIAQLYIGKKDSKLIRPAKELKGFAKVFLKAGESKEVAIKFDDKSFRYFNTKTNKWEVEDGSYQLYVSASVEDDRLTGEIAKQGTTTVMPYDKADLPSYFACDVANISEEEFEKLLGRKVEGKEHVFYKKNRMVIHENCTVEELRYSKRWVGRLFSGGIRFAIGLLRAFGQRGLANTLVMGVQYQPVRGLAKFGGMSRRQLEGMLAMFNGHFFKGLGMILFKSKEEKAKIKAEKAKNK